MTFNIAFVPLLVLVAAYSCEAAFDTYTSLNSTTDPTRNWINKVNQTLTITDAEGNPKTDRKPLLCPVLDISNYNSSCGAVSYTNRDWIQTSFDTTNMTFADNMKPVTVMARACHSLWSSTNRKWRKFNDKFAKDKHCSFFEVNMEAKVPFVKGPMKMLLEVPEDAPETAVSVQLYFICEGQPANQYCAIADNYRKAKMFFMIEPIDSIPKKMTVITLIMVFVGPLCLIVYVCWDKLIKKLK